MYVSGHSRSVPFWILSLAAVPALGCSVGWTPGAEQGEAAEQPSLGAQLATPSHSSRCGGGHFGSHADWTSAAPLPAPRTRHSAVLLPDGQVLVGGGLGLSSNPTDVALYDPATDTWETGGALPGGPPETRAAVLLDGRVLFSPGGAVYDPSTGTSTPVPLTPAEALGGWPFAHSTLTRLPSGQVLRTGGDDDESYLKEAVLYDAATNTWSSAGAMSVSRALHTATLLADGRVLLVGGYTLNGDQLPAGRTTADIYDPATGAWTKTAPTNVPRMQHTATLLPSGRVLVIGGGGRIYDYSGEEEQGQVVVYAEETAEIYDPASNTWTLTAPPSLQHGPSHTATLLADGRVLAVDRSGAELYKESADKWTTTESPTPRGHHAATAMPDGSVLVTGGNDGTVFSNAPEIASVEIYGTACSNP